MGSYKYLTRLISTEKMKLIMIRHCECIGNLGKDPWSLDAVRIGTMDLPLTDKGKKQSKKLAKKLSKTKIDVIYSSDLVRAKETAEEIAKSHKLHVIYKKELRERNLGELTGLTVKEIREKLKEIPGDPERKKPKGGESRLEFKERVEKFFKWLVKKYGKENKTVVLVTHSGVIRVILMFLYKIPFNFENLKKVHQILNIDLSPGSFITFEIDRNFNFKKL